MSETETRSNDGPVTQGFVLAAGLGTRMRPITDKIPKPLVQVQGKTMLDYALDALNEAGVGTAVVNVHYLADQLEDHVSQRTAPRILISDERQELLNSGGGVKHGLPLLTPDPFVILNADSFWIDGDENNLRKLMDTWNPESMDMLMLLAPLERSIGFDGKGDFFRNEDGTLHRRGEALSAPYAYCGAIITKPSLFLDVKEAAFNMNILFDSAIASGRLHGVVLDGLWLHVGTPNAISEAERAIMAEKA